MPDKKTTQVSRREFARRAAIAAAASFAPASALASTATTTEPLPITTTDLQTTASLAMSSQAQPAKTPALSPESQLEVDARVQTILSRYGSRLSEEQKSDIRRLSTLAQPPLDRLRAYPLQNGDDPALYLKPLVERDKKPVPVSPPAPKPPAAPEKLLSNFKEN